MLTYETDPPAAPAPGPGRYYPGDDQTPEDWYLTAEEAAAYVNLSKRWFYLRVKALVKSYPLPTFGHRFYRRSELERFRGLRQ